METWDLFKGIHCMVYSFKWVGLFLPKCKFEGPRSQANRLTGCAVPERKAVFCVCEQQLRRTAYASAQSDQRLHLSLIGKYKF